MIRIFLVIVFAMLLSSCAPGNPFEGTEQIDVLCGSHGGFWQGLGHGLVTPFSLIASWFDSSVGIYNYCNNGGWYDFGFLWGVGIVSGGSTCSAARR